MASLESSLIAPLPFPDSGLTTLDVFVLTFNAAKQFVDPSVFSLYLRDAFAKNATGLPELVVFCLQEMVPLAQGLIGPRMVKPYFQKYVSAVNLAARPPNAAKPSEGREDSEGHRDGSQDAYPNGDEDEDSPYTLVTTRHVGLTGIMLMARDPSALHDVKSTEVSFGAGSMANKGAVGVRFSVSKEDAAGRERQTELTFVGAHLAAHEYNLDRRNKNWESIVSGLLFEDPHLLHGGASAHPEPRASGGGDDDERESLLSEDSRDKASHDITIYKPGSHLFVAGDLNYRIDITTPRSGAVLPEYDPESPHHFKHFLDRDQLTSERMAGKTLHGLHEAPILFPPTYKLQGIKDDEVLAYHRDGRPGRLPPWRWVRSRWPGWCDRVLYLDLPSWLSGGPAAEPMQMTTIAYDALPPVQTSDHRAVFLRIQVPVLEPSLLVPPHDVRASDSVDPRVKLPYKVDVEAWSNRARVKEWEPIIGWSMLISQWKSSIAVFVAVLLIGLGTWWTRSR